MKRLIIFLLFFLSFGCKAQEINLPSLGTKTLYQPSHNPLTKMPFGFKAVYINYVGRHGARHLTKDVKISLAYRMLQKADSLHLLSIVGVKLRKAVLNLDKVEEKNISSISSIGAAEQKGIARRMYLREESVFSSSNTVLNVYTTKKGRTKESAEAFIQGLKAEKTGLAQNVNYNYADDIHLRFYDFSKAYLNFEEDGDWKHYYDALSKQTKFKEMQKKFTAQFFLKPFVINEKEEADFIEDIYGFYAIENAIGIEIKQANLSVADVEFRKYFTKSALETLGRLGDAEDFLKKGPGTNSNGIQVRIAAPLLVDFINATDNFLKTGVPQADLRFAHAETIAPFAAIMGIKGASQSTTSISSFKTIWQAAHVIPFSANIQWILYKNAATGKFKIKFLLNENEVSINGLKTKTFPYYDWTIVRDFYIRKLQAIKVGLNEDMGYYLENVK
ncbi:multiple inositol-polyphosphate phosphatase/2,3-bisphosphoglycerate 3-phosphatase [Pedobacter sp. UYEF25]